MQNNSLSFVDSDKQTVFFPETESSAKVIVQSNNAIKHILSKILTECRPYYCTLHVTKLPTRQSAFYISLVQLYSRRVCYARLWSRQKSCCSKLCMHWKKERKRNAETMRKVEIAKGYNLKRREKKRGQRKIESINIKHRHTRWVYY